MGGDHQGDVIVGQVEGYGLKLIAFAEGENRGALDKEGTVGTQQAGIIHHGIGRKAEVKRLVNEFDKIPGIGGSASKARSYGDVLVKVDTYWWQMVIVLDEVVGLDAEVIFYAARNAESGCLEAQFVALNYLEHIVNFNGVKNGF